MAKDMSARVSLLTLLDLDFILPKARENSINSSICKHGVLLSPSYVASPFFSVSR
jgi:hypothetical protein